MKIYDILLYPLKLSCSTWIDHILNFIGGREFHFDLREKLTTIMTANC